MRRERRKIAHRRLFKSPSAALVAINFSLSPLPFALSSPEPTAFCDCPSAGVGGGQKSSSDPVAIRWQSVRTTNHCRRRSRDRWPTRPTHNAKKTPTPLITTAPARMRRRKSSVHFSLYILSRDTWRRSGGRSRAQSMTTW